MRQAECKRVLTNRPQYVPVIVEPALKESSLPILEKRKFLVPHDLTMGQFNMIVHNKLRAEAVRTQAKEQQNAAKGPIFLFVGESHALVPVFSILSIVYSENKSKDGFLYIVYAHQDNFG